MMLVFIPSEIACHASPSASQTASRPSRASRPARGNRSRPQWREVAAANRRDQAHALAAALVSKLGRELLVPDPIIVEVDQLLRSRLSDHAALGLGYADATVMAIAEREQLPILTFDFPHFRATQSKHGYWELVIDEHRYHQHVAA